MPCRQPSWLPVRGTASSTRSTRDKRWPCQGSLLWTAQLAPAPEPAQNAVLSDADLHLLRAGRDRYERSAKLIRDLVLGGASRGHPPQHIHLLGCPRFSSVAAGR